MFFNAEERVPLIAGTGRVVVVDVSIGQGSTTMLIASGANLFTYGNFEDPRYQVDWRFSGTKLPIRSNERARSGSYSLRLSAEGGGASRARREFSAKPGQNAVLELWYFVVGMDNANALIYVTLSWVDNGGNSLLTATLANGSADTKSWECLRSQFTRPAPAGSVGLVVDINLFRIVRGEPIVYIDDVVCNIY